MCTCEKSPLADCLCTPKSSGDACKGRKTRSSEAREASDSIKIESIGREKVALRLIHAQEDIIFKMINKMAAFVPLESKLCWMIDCPLGRLFLTPCVTVGTPPRGNYHLAC